MSSLRKEVKAQIEQALAAGEENWDPLPRNRFDLLSPQSYLTNLREVFQTNEIKKRVQFVSRGFRRLQVNMNSPRSETVVRAAIYGLAVGAIGVAAILRNKE